MANFPVNRRTAALSGLLAMFTVLTGGPGATGAGAETAPVRIVAFGDSLTAGFGVAEADSFPAQLQRYLHGRGLAAEVINAGVSGDTTAGGLARLKWVLADRPRFAIVCLGANDGLRGLPPAAARVNLDRILTGFAQAGVTVLLAGMLAPPNLGPDYARAFNPIFADLAERHRVAFYPFFLDGVATRPELNQADGMHPNRAGVAVIVERLGPLVARMVAGSP